MLYGRYFDIPRREPRRTAELLDFGSSPTGPRVAVEPLSGNEAGVTIAFADHDRNCFCLADEPQGLDPQARALLWDRLYRLKQRGVTLVITTTTWTRPSSCATAVVMDRAQIAAQGSQLHRSSTRRARCSSCATRPAHEARSADVAASANGSGASDRVLSTPTTERPLNEVHGRAATTRARFGSSLEEVFLPPHGRSWSSVETPSDREPVIEGRSPPWLTTPRSARGEHASHLPADLALELCCGSCSHCCTCGNGPRCGRAWSTAANSLENWRGLSNRVHRPRPVGDDGDDGVVQEAMWPVVGAHVSTRIARGGHPLTPGQMSPGPRSGRRPAPRSLSPGGDRAAVLRRDAVARLLFAIHSALTGLAFSVPLTAWSSTRDRETSFPSIQRFVIVPLFLFGGTFYPVEQLPGWMHPIAKATPLWHGVQLCRDSVLHRLEIADTLAHVGVLCAFVGAGLAVCRVTYSRRLAE